MKTKTKDSVVNTITLSKLLLRRPKKKTLFKKIQIKNRLRKKPRIYKRRIICPLFKVTMHKHIPFHTDVAGHNTQPKKMAYEFQRVKSPGS